MTTSIRYSNILGIKTTTQLIPKIDIPNLITNTSKNPHSCLIAGAKHLSVYRMNDMRIFFVHKDLQKQINFNNARIGILSNLGLLNTTTILQVIGDCIPFSNQGTQKVKYIVNNILKYPNQLLLWGYTGSERDNGTKLDINQILNTWVDASPMRGNQVLANVVDVDTPKALREWNCHGSETVKNFYLVNGEAKFGEDIESSDFLTDKACCFDGGIQSFRQMANMLMRDINIQCYYGFRDETTYFSAVEFMKFISDEIQKYYKYNNLVLGKIPEKMEVANEFLEVWKNDYLEKHPLSNPAMNDPIGKKVLFEAAWQFFLEKKLWKKLYLCEFLTV